MGPGDVRRVGRGRRTGSAEMMPLGLREDALASTPAGFELRVGLPWIRALPLAGLSELSVTLDNHQLDGSNLQIVLGDRRIPPESLGDETDIWWYLQDRLVLAG